MRRDSLRVALSLVTLGLSGGIAHAKRYDGLSVAKERLSRITRDHRVSQAAKPVVAAAIAEMLRPYHHAVAHAAPLAGLQTTVRGSTLHTHASYQVGLWSDLSSQTLTVSLRTGKGRLTSRVYEGPGRVDTVETKKLGE